MREEDKKVLKLLLKNPQAFLPPRFFYDDLGGILFEAITRLEEYTPTKDELSIFDNRLQDIKDILPPSTCLIDLGAGNCSKAEKVLSQLCPEIFLAVDLPSAFFSHMMPAYCASCPNVSLYLEY